MAYQLLVASPVGFSKQQATVSAPVGTETIAASVPVGSIGLVLEDTVAKNSVEVVDALERLIELFQENNK